MAVVTLQFPPSLAVSPGAFTSTVAFSGVQYRMRFVWDNRANMDAGAWRVDLRSSNGAAILLGLKLVLTDDLWRLFHYRAGVPIGALRVRRTDKLTTDPGLTELGGPVALEYVTS